jgi:hypothetical protein
VPAPSSYPAPGLTPAVVAPRLHVFGYPQRVRGGRTSSLIEPGAAHLPVCSCAFYPGRLARTIDAIPFPSGFSLDEGNTQHEGALCNGASRPEPNGLNGQPLLNPIEALIMRTKSLITGTEIAITGMKVTLPDPEIVGMHSVSASTGTVIPTFVEWSGAAK